MKLDDTYININSLELNKKNNPIQSLILAMRFFFEFPYTFKMHNLNNIKRCVNITISFMS